MRTVFAHPVSSVAPKATTATLLCSGLRGFNSPRTQANGAAPVAFVANPYEAGENPRHHHFFSRNPKVFRVRLS